ncbi:MAG: hypothetical protein ACK5XV_13265 [Flavobacteriales bacterium]
MRCRLSLLFFLLFPCLVAAQNATLRGRIRNAQGEAQPGVIIRQKDNPAAGTSTDIEGRFSLLLPAGQNITILFKGTGARESASEFFLRPGEIREVEITYDATVEVSMVEVVDVRSREDGIKPITVKLPTRLPTIQQGIEAYLIQAPVNFPSELSSSYSVRGGSFDENLVYVNDIQVYRPFLVRAGEQEGLSFPNPDMVRSIDFSAGGFQARFGDKMSSVLDIQYARPDSFGGTFQIGLLGAQLQLEGISRNRKLTHNTGVRYRDNAYVLNSLDVSGDYNPRYADVQTYITWRPGHEYGPWELSFLGNYANNRYNFIPATRETDVGSINEALRLTVFFEGQEVTRFETFFGAFAARYNPSETSQIKIIASAFQTYESEYFDILGAYRLDELERDLGSDSFGEVLRNRGVGGFLQHGRNDLAATVYSGSIKGFKDFDARKHLLQYGADVQVETVNDELNEYILVDSAGYASPRPPDPIGYTDPADRPFREIAMRERIRATNEVNSSRISAYVQDTWRRNLSNDHSFSATAGIRANHWTWNGETVISPRANFSYTPRWLAGRVNQKTGAVDSIRKDIVLTAAVGYFYQPPFYREMRGFDGQVNPDIRAQRSIHYIMGADYLFRAWERSFKVVAEAYYKQMDRLIPYEVENVRQRYFARNNARGYATGLDVMVNGEFIEGVQSWIRASVLKTEEDLSDDFFFLYLNSDGDTIRPGFTINDSPVDSIRQEPGFIPRPPDQRFSFSMLFLDEMPRKPWYKLSVNFFFATGVPYGPPSRERYLDVNRTRSYIRADVGFSRDLFHKKKRKDGFAARYIERGNIALEIFNLLGVNNIVNHQWIEDVDGRLYGIPTYLTGRRINLRFSMDF